jgi:hypothetical protein
MIIVDAITAIINAAQENTPAPRFPWRLSNVGKAPFAA